MRPPGSPSRPSPWPGSAAGCAIARSCLADEPVHAGAVWVSDYEINPFDVPEAERVGRMAELSERLLASDGVDHVEAAVQYAQENKFYADSAGTTTTQQRVRIEPEFTVTNVDRARGGFETMRTSARRPRGAGSTRPAPVGTSTPRSRNCRNCCSNAPRRRAWRPAATTW